MPEHEPTYVAHHYPTTRAHGIYVRCSCGWVSSSSRNRAQIEKKYRTHVASGDVGYPTDSPLVEERNRV